MSNAALTALLLGLVAVIFGSRVILNRLRASRDREAAAPPSDLALQLVGLASAIGALVVLAMFFRRML